MSSFKVQEEVMARWPGSSLWFKGTVVDFNDIEYQVMFEDEAKSEYVIKHRDVKSMFDFRPRPRSVSRGRSRSRGRSSKGRSPARKSPARKSPGRPPKKKKEMELLLQKERERERLITTTTTVEEVTVVKRGSQEAEALVWVKNDSPMPTARPRLSRADLHTPRTSTPTRQSPRFTITDKPAPGLGSRLCGLPCKLGSLLKGVLCALIPSLATLLTLPAMAIMLAMPVVLNEMCTKNKCTVMELPSIPRSVRYYYDPLAVAIVAGFMVVQTLLCLVPLGRKVQPISRASVRCNGFVAVVATLAVVPVCLYMDYNILVVYSKYRHLMATSLVFGLVLALVGYILGHYAPRGTRNPAGNSGSFLADYFMGKEIAPVVLSLDLKFVLFRISCLSQIIINVLIVVRDLQSHPGQYSPTLLLAAIMQIFYAANWIWFEDAYFTTYEYQRQGFGLFLILGDLALPFILPIFTRFVLNHVRTELEWYWLTAIALLNLTGYTICRGANNQKHAFRSNPSNPALARLESLPTAAGTRLLVSGWWGLVRHPNYLGDILIFVSWALVCAVTIVPVKILLRLAFREGCLLKSDYEADGENITEVRLQKGRTAWCSKVFDLSDPRLPKHYSRPLALKKEKVRFSNALPWLLVALDVLFLVARTYEVEESCSRKYGAAWDSYTKRVKCRLIPKVF
ncbi:Lamin-B receptor [Chionoecetes opilio]|uniref:Lamin-B receptor n=1 Tax=Chionoecetes opilio TaxID=41210 RepID=A0A8J8WFP7_CHIOP|nr:Lamin-B receptor [Chionoecetes opilio]